MLVFVTIQLSVASGGPAGGQTFEKFDKQVLFVLRQFGALWVFSQSGCPPLVAGGEAECVIHGQSP
jgi:hypothetical protein